MPLIRETDVFKEWIRALAHPETQGRINLRIRRLSLGNPGDVEPVGEGVSEMKIDVGPGYRVYFKNKGDEFVILLCGGDKSTQRSDIARAKALARQLGL